MSTTKNNLKDETITRNELRTLLKAMDREGFDKVMEDYLKEVSDPNNVKEMNEFLKQSMDSKDLPSNVKLAKPLPGFCLKSTKFNTKRPAQRSKVYVNICQLSNVAEPAADSRDPSMWSLPFLLNKPRNDQDSKGNICYTYDVVFNVKAIQMSKQYDSFKKFVCDTALNGLNDNFLKQNNEKISADYSFCNKFDYKGVEVAYINIHSLEKSSFANKLEPADNYKTTLQKEVNQLKSNNNEENENENENDFNDDNENKFDKVDFDVEDSNKSLRKNKEKIKQVSFKYREKVELDKYFYTPEDMINSGSYDNSGSYSILVIELNVDKIGSLAEAELELETKFLKFKYKDLYDLNVELPNEVVKEKGQAKFNRDKGILTIEVPIVKKALVRQNVNEDDNIEYVKYVEKEEKSEKNVNNNKEMRRNENSKDMEKDGKENFERDDDKNIKYDVGVNGTDENKKDINNVFKDDGEDKHVVQKRNDQSLINKEIKEENEHKEPIKTIAKLEEEKTSTDKPLIQDISIITTPKQQLDEDDKEQSENTTSNNNNKSQTHQEIEIFNFKCHLIHEID